MKKIIAAAALLLITLHCKAQDGSEQKSPDSIMQADSPGKYARNLPDTIHSTHYRFGFWYTPVWHSTVVEGVAIGYWAAPVGKNEKTTFLHINGINIAANPVAILFLPYIFGGSFSYPFLNEKRDWDYYYIYPGNDTEEHVLINGISVSTLLMYGEMNGLAINSLCGRQNEMNGMEISGMMNMHYSFTGVQIATFRNKATKGRGIQIGLINNCKKGTVLQIGLLNTIGKRTLPFINFGFAKKHKTLK